MDDQAQLPPLEELLSQNDELDSALAAVGFEMPEALAAKPAAPSGPGIMANLKEVPGQIVRGAAEGFNAANAGLSDLGKWLNTNIVDLGSIHVGEEAQGKGVKGWITWSPGVDNASPFQIPDSALPAKPETTLGKLTNDVSQLGVGLLGAGKFLKLAGWGASATTAGAFGRAATAGAVADFSVFDGNDERLSNFLVQYPMFQNPVTEFLAAKPDDNEALGRLKNAVEGLGVGTAVEALLYSARIAKAWRAGDKKGAAEVAEELDEAATAARAEEAKAPEGQPAKADDSQGDLFGDTPQKPAGDAKEAAKEAKPEGFKADEDGQLDMGLQGSRSPDSPNAVLDEGIAAVPPPGTHKAAGDSTKYFNPEAMKAPVKKLIEVDEAGLEKIIADRDWQSGLFPDTKGISGIRTDLIENGGEIEGIMDTLTRVYEKQITKVAGGNADGVRTFETVRRNADLIADTIGVKSDMILRRMALQERNVSHMDAELRAYADFMATVGSKTTELANFVAGTGGPIPAKYASRNELMADFAKHTQLMVEVQARYRSMQTNTARALNAFKLGAKVNPELLAKMDPDTLFQGGAEAMEALARRVVATGGDLKALNNVTRPGFLKNVIGTAQEVWINGLLSGPKTHVVNVIGSALTAAYVPAEKMLAGAIRSGTKEGREDFVEAAAEYVGLVASMKDALFLSARSAKEGKPILDASRNAIDDIPNAITAKNYGMDEEGISGRTVDALGTFFRVPSRLLTSEDEFVKQMSYRSQVRARAIREHLFRGETDTKALAERIEEALERSVDDQGRALDDVAMDQARRTTFSNSLKAPTHWGGSTLGESVQRLTENHPFMRVVIPFVRTPTNITRFVWQRTPVANAFRKPDWDDMVGKNGPKAQADFLSRTVMGSAIWGIAASMALDGTITGGGPADKDMRKALEETGWKPYARKLVDPDTGKVSYVQLNRLDPFSSFFAIAADFTEAAGYMGQNDLDKTATMLVAALARNFQSKTYLQGITQAVEAAAHPDRRIHSWAKNMAGTLVPYHAFLSQTLVNDPNMREARTIVDQLRTKVPMLSEGVDPSRNVFGEKRLSSPGWGPDFISPFAVGVKDHVAGPQPVTKDWQVTPSKDPYDELARLSYMANAPIRPTDAKIGGVDLTQFKHPNGIHTAADRFAELSGTIRINGRTMKEEVTKVIGSNAYARATDGDAMNDGSRIDIVRRVVGGYRQQAQAVLFRENPAIKQAFELERYKKAVAKGAAKGPPAQPSASSQLPGLPPVE